MEKLKDSRVIRLKRSSMPECNGCIWYERDGRNSDCINRKKIICRLYIEKLFGDLNAGTP